MSGALNTGSARGLLRVVSPEELTASENEAYLAAAAAQQTQQAVNNLSAYIRTKWSQFRSHRSSATGWNDRLLNAMRVFNGQYSATRLAEIRKFGGSEVYARLIGVKCRGATSLLRDVYLGPERAWAIAPTPTPTIPDDVTGSALQLLQVEAQTLSQSGQPVDDGMLMRRLQSLMEAARQAAVKQAKDQAGVATKKLDDLLVEGNFYKALAEFMVDLPLFPFAVMKGPVVRIVPSLTWQGGQPVVTQKPKLFWNRVSPFDFWFTPGVSDIEDAECIEKVKLTRSDLNDLLGLPGYNEQAIRAVLDEYGRGGLVDWLDPTDAERAVAENREDPHLNRSGLIDCLEWHGPIQGRLLREQGFSEQAVPDEMRDVFVQAWVIGNHVIKVQLSPTARRRHPYFITSFEKVPGTVVGNGLPDMLEDIQDVANAALRALVNNLSISSGPQVVVNTDRLSATENGDELYPWKRWFTVSDPMGNNGQAPVSFFQPESNAQQLLMVYEKFTQMADELSAIPRYITGSERLGGAGRTASGLAMLMGNASKILQTVASNVDRDVMQPLLQSLYDMVMLTDETGTLRGDESIEVLGVNVAIQKETERQRQLEFLQVTSNPIDMQIVGVDGRAKLLRSVSKTLGLPGEEIVPSDEVLKAKIQAAQKQPMPPASTGDDPAKPREPQGPQTNTVQ